jgi:hypothetical protein
MEHHDTTDATALASSVSGVVIEDDSKAREDATSIDSTNTTEENTKATNTKTTKTEEPPTPPALKDKGKPTPRGDWHYDASKPHRALNYTMMIPMEAGVGQFYTYIVDFDRCGEQEGVRIETEGGLKPQAGTLWARDGKILLSVNAPQGDDDDDSQGDGDWTELSIAV